VAEVGTSKPLGGGGGGQGRTISLIGCSASGAYASGPDDEDENGGESGILICVYTRSGRMNVPVNVP
jgi:hypothetical protein